MKKDKENIPFVVWFISTVIFYLKKEEKKKEKKMCSNHNLNFVLKDTAIKTILLARIREKEFNLNI